MSNSNPLQHFIDNEMAYLEKDRGRLHKENVKLREENEKLLKWIEQIELLKDLVDRYKEVRKLEDEVSALKFSYERATESNGALREQYNELKSAHDDLWKAYNELLEELARVNGKDHVWYHHRLDDIVYIQNKIHNSPLQYYKAIVTTTGLMALDAHRTNHWSFEEADDFLNNGNWVAIYKEDEYEELMS